MVARMRPPPSMAAGNGTPGQSLQHADWLDRNRAFDGRGWPARLRALCEPRDARWNCRPRAIGNVLTTARMARPSRQGDVGGERTKRVSARHQVRRPAAVRGARSSRAGLATGAVALVSRAEMDPQPAGLRARVLTLT